MTNIASTVLAERTSHHAVTLLDNAYSTQPAYEARGLNPFEVCGLIAPVEPAVVVDKHHAPFFVTTVLKEAEFVGKTREKAIAAGIPTVGKQRSAAHVVEGSVVKLDLDGITDEALRDLRDTLDRLELAYVLYTTHSHGCKDKPGSRLRLILFLDRPLPPNDYKATA